MLRSIGTFSFLSLLSLMSALTQGAQVDVDWYIPSGNNLPPKTAKVGDRAVFVWEDFHDVHLHPSKTCDETGAISVGSSSGATYTFSEVGEFIFACDVGQHCENGQIVTFTVSATDSTDAPVATTAPVAASTTAPVVAPTSAPVGSGSAISTTSLVANAVLMMIVASGLIE